MQTLDQIDESITVLNEEDNRQPILGRISLQNESKEAHMSDLDANKYPLSQISEKTDVLPSSRTTDTHDVRDILLKNIIVSEFCERSEYGEDITSLADNIKQNGLIHYPTVIKDGNDRYLLVCGSRRLQAYRSIGRKMIPCQVRNMTQEEAACLSFVENSSRLDRHPVEEAKILRNMKDQFHWTDAETANAIGMPQTYVAERMGILRLSDDILAHVDTRPESPFKFTHAVALSKLVKAHTSHGNIEIQELQKKTVGQRLSTTELKALVRLVRDGDYDRLPDNLRMSLLKSERMTSRMAELYLRPEDLFDDEDTKRHQIAEGLDKKDIEQLITKAIKAEWPYDKTEQNLKAMIDRELTAEKPQNRKPESICQKLLKNVAIVCNNLMVNTDDEVSRLAKYAPQELETLRNVIGTLQGQLDNFQTSVSFALNEQGLTQNTKEEALDVSLS